MERVKGKKLPDIPARVTEHKPEWLKVKVRHSPNHLIVNTMLRGLGLHTVCEEAHCPNILECFGNRTATFIILGPICTRNCRFCAVAAGQPLIVDPSEPAKIAQAVSLLQLQYVVITSVTRDDLTDGGAGQFRAVIEKIKSENPGCSVEVLIPDFQGSLEALQIVVNQKPEVLNHNVETVPRLYPAVRAQAQYDRSIFLLANAKDIDPRITTKSGIMVGLGESLEEVLEVVSDLRDANCDILTIGQYLRPSLQHPPVERYYTPQEFSWLRAKAMEMGIRYVESGPLVRSSYNAHLQIEALS